MVLNTRVREYYCSNPLMVSSPFGGVDGIRRDLVLDVFERLGIGVAGRKILDVGCGRGYVGQVVRDQGGDYTGLDFAVSRTGLRQAVGDAASLPFPDAAFDGILCLDALEHFPDIDQAVAEFRRVLRASGFAFLSAPNYANIAGIVKKYCETFGRYEANTWAPFRNWQPQELEQALTARRVRRAFRRAGFVRIRRMGYAGEAGLGLFPWIEHPSMPEAIKFRLQRLFNTVGPAVVRVWPNASLHSFWKFDG